jgi:hypothetical protein
MKVLKIIIKTLLVLFLLIVPIFVIIYGIGWRNDVLAKVGGSLYMTPSFPKIGDTVDITVYGSNNIQLVDPIPIKFNKAKINWCERVIITQGTDDKTLQNVVKYKIDPISGNRIGSNQPVVLYGKSPKIKICIAKNKWLEGKSVYLDVYTSEYKRYLIKISEEKSTGERIWNVLKVTWWICFVLIVIGIIFLG